MRRLITLTAAAAFMLVSAAPATADTVGMTVDRVRGAVTVFDADNDVFLGKVQIPGGEFNVADCSILADQSLGFVTSFSTGQVWVIDLTGENSASESAAKLFSSIGSFMHPDLARNWML